MSNAEATQTNLDGVASQDLSVAINFERINWATGSVGQDELHQLSSKFAGATIGEVIKVEAFTNRSKNTLPPNTALSRIMDMAEDVNGTAITTLVYVLWPDLLLTQADGRNSLVSWGHGTSGRFGECAPPHIQNL